jgi:hypothetical protein
LDPEEYAVKAVTSNDPFAELIIAPVIRPVFAIWSSAGIVGEAYRMTGWSLSVVALTTLGAVRTFSLKASERSLNVKASSETEYANVLVAVAPVKATLAVSVAIDDPAGVVGIPLRS